jgi:ABC-type microcin C transport system permease subunit YejB
MHHIFAVLLFLLPLNFCVAQVAPGTPVEPKAIGIVYRLSPSGQELIRIPDEQAQEKAGSRDPRKIFVEVQGAQSSFRIKAGESTEFVFSTGNPEKVSLYRFEQKKNKRQVQTMMLDIRGGGKLLKGLSAEVSKHGESSYKLVPSAPLTSGEYAVFIADQVYTFGID